MNKHQLSNKVLSATKWSTITEIMAKLVSPISTMILARILAPEAFGVVATVNMIFSFADMFTDAGFQKYLIQHEFEKEENKYQYADVAFWTNLFISVFLWGLIAYFSEPLSSLLGSPGLGITLVVACASLPITAFSSIQMALYKRNFDFKTLFYVRIAGILVPLFVTIPLALVFKNYWALIFGTIGGNITNAIILTLKSSWKPRLRYDFKILKDMFSYSMWILMESIVIWLNAYIDTFFVGLFLSTYYLGIYKTSMTTVNQITNLIVKASTPILFSTLCRLQYREKEFNDFYLKFQRLCSILLIPMGVGIFCYREFVTVVLLGEQWTETADFIGMWALVGSFAIVVAQYASEAYRAVGKAKVAVWAQIICLLILIPFVYIGAKRGYNYLCISRSSIRIVSVVVNSLLLWKYVGISPIKVIRNIFPMCMASAVMAVAAWKMQTVTINYVCEVISIIICILIYFIVLLVFPKEREVIMSLAKGVIKKVKYR